MSEKKRPDADIRDTLVRRTPPDGIRAQLAAESWEDKSHTPIEGTPVMTADEALRSTESRTRELKNTSIDLKKDATTTLQLLHEHKKETAAQFAVVHGKIDGTNAKVDNQTAVLSDLRVDVAESRGENRQILSRLDELKEERRHKQEVTTRETIAQIETRTARALSEAEVEKAQKLAETEADKAQRIADADIRKAKWSAIWAWVGKGAVIVGLIATAVGAAKC